MTGGGGASGVSKKLRELEDYTQLAIREEKLLRESRAKEAELTKRKHAIQALLGQMSAGCPSEWHMTPEDEVDAAVQSVCDTNTWGEGHEQVSKGRINRIQREALKLLKVVTSYAAAADMNQSKLFSVLSEQVNLVVNPNSEVLKPDKSAPKWDLLAGWATELKRVEADALEASSFGLSCKSQQSSKGDELKCSSRTDVVDEVIEALLDKVITFSSAVGSSSQSPATIFVRDRTAYDVCLRQSSDSMSVSFSTRRRGKVMRITLMSDGHSIDVTSSFPLPRQCKEALQGEPATAALPSIAQTIIKEDIWSLMDGRYVW